MVLTVILEKLDVLFCKTDEIIKRWEIFLTDIRRCKLSNAENTPVTLSIAISYNKCRFFLF